MEPFCRCEFKRNKLLVFTLFPLKKDRLYTSFLIIANMYKQIFFVLLILLSFNLVFADIGPSPSYTFSISNVLDYSDYAFYYSGNLWKGKLELLSEGSVSVYKFNTDIKIFAVKRSLLEENFIDPQYIEYYDGEFVVSNEISLGGGNNILKINSFDDENKGMSVLVDKFELDTSYLVKLLFFDPIGWIFLIVIICIIFGGFTVIKNIRKKSK